MKIGVTVKILLMLIFCLISHAAMGKTLAANNTPEKTIEYQLGDRAFLCFKRMLHPNWPEVFAIQVEVIELLPQRLRVRVVNEYPMDGRTNEEETPVQGDVMKISISRIYSEEQAGVQPGSRFNGKPVCHKLMQ